MSWQEYREWLAYEAVEPFGAVRGDWQAALVAQSAMAPHVKKVPEISDFLLFPESRFAPPPDEDAEWEEWDRVLERAAARAARSESAGG